MKQPDSKSCKDFARRMGHIELIAQVVYDMTGCEKVTNIAFFALLEDLIEAFTAILTIKVIGAEKPLVAILDTIDAVFLLTLN